jgi:hypothetical protein
MLKKILIIFLITLAGCTAPDSQRQKEMAYVRMLKDVYSDPAKAARLEMARVIVELDKSR